MARSLSWIDNDELNALFDVVGPKRGQPAAKPQPAPGKDSWSEFGARRPVAPRPAASGPAAPRPVAPRPVRPVAPRPVTARPATPPPAAAQIPVAQAPVAQAPAVQIPVAQAPAVQIPVVQAPVAQAVTAPPELKVVPFRPEQGANLAARLEQFFDWVLAQAPVQGVVIADDQGLVVARREAGELEASLAIGLEQLFGRVSNLFAEDAADKADVSGHVVLRHKERLLITVWTPTDYGRYYGVLIGRSVPGAEVLELAGQGLEIVFAA